MNTFAFVGFCIAVIIFWSFAFIAMVSIFEIRSAIERIEKKLGANKEDK